MRTDGDGWAKPLGKETLGKKTSESKTSSEALKILKAVRDLPKNMNL